MGKTSDPMKIQCGKAGELLAWPPAHGERLQPGTAPCHCPTSTVVTVKQSLCQGALGSCLDTDPKKRLCLVVEKHLECAKAQGSITRGRPWASSSRNLRDLQVPCAGKGRRERDLCYIAEHADSFLLPLHSSLQPSSWVSMKLPDALRLRTTHKVSWFTPKW